MSLGQVSLGPVNLALTVLGAVIGLAGFALMFANVLRLRRTRQRTPMGRQWAMIACLFVGAALMQMTSVQRQAEHDRQREAIMRETRGELAKAEQQLDRSTREVAALKAETQEVQAR